MTNKMISSHARDRMQLLLVGLVVSGYCVLCLAGIDYGSGGKWVAMFRLTEFAAIGAFLVAKFVLSAPWRVATVMAGNVFLMPRFAVGAFFGAKDFLHLHWIFAAIFAIPPMAILLMIIVALTRIGIKQIFGIN